MLLNKPLVLRALLADCGPGEAVYVELDARRRDVVVPANLEQERLVLKIEPGTNAYRVTDRGLDVYMGFQTKWMWCFIPWHALHKLALHDKALVVWSDGVEAGPPTNDVGEPTAFPHLRLIRGGLKDIEPPTEPAPLNAG